MELKMEVYTSALELLGVLEVFDSLLMDQRAFGAGSFSLESMLTDQTRPLLQPENILWFEGETAGIIEAVWQRAGQEDMGVTVKGPLLTGLLARRILWGRYDLTGSPGQIMNRLVEDCCIHPTRGDTQARILPGLVLAEDTGSQGDAIRIQKTGGSLLEALEQIGQTYQVAFGIRFNPQVPRLEFWTRLGLDRSVEQEEREPVFYSTELDDVLSSEYCYDSSDYHNICLAAGEGEGADRITVTVTGKVEQPEPGPGPGPEPERYTVSLAAQPEGGGTVSGGGEVAAGGQITVTAVPAEGYAFAGWQEEGAIVSTEPAYSFVVAADRALTALFALILPTYTIAVSLEEGQQGWGTVSGGGQYRQGDPVTVTATPAEGYQFVEWRENGQQVGTEAAYTFPAEQDRSLIAVFAVASRLPAGYTEVEYIHWDGNHTTFALLENVVGNTDKVLLKVKPDKVNGGSSAPSWILYIGTLVSSSGRYLSLKAYGSVLNYILNYTAEKTYTFSSGIVNTMLEFSLDFLSKKFTVNGISLTGFRSSHSLGTMVNCLGRTAKSTQSASKYAMQGYFYSMSHYRNNSLIREYVPCVAPNGKAGIFELFSKTFIENTCNSATGITPGPAV